MEATVYVYDRNIDRLRELDIAFGGRADTCYASTLDIEQRLPEIDLVIGAVLVAGAKAPYVIRREQLSLMKRNAVLVDVSIDQGGCFETSHPTTHSDPTYEVDGITHYCVANMPGAVPITSTRALTNATLPYVLHVADVGVAAGRAREPGAGEGRQRGRRQGDLPAGGGGDGRALRGAVRGARRGRVSRYDAVIVGGGHNGLVAAAYLARGGALRARARAARPASAAPPCPSGRGPAWTRGCRATPTSSRCCRGAVADELRIGVEMRRRSVVSYTPRADGSGLLVRSGAPPHETWRRFYLMTARVAQAVFPTFTQPLPSRDDLRARVDDDEAWEIVFERPLGETLAEWFPDDVERGIVLTDALIGTFASADDPLLRQNRCFAYHVTGNGTGDWDVPVGGMGARQRRAGRGRALGGRGAALRRRGDVDRPGRARCAGRAARRRPASCSPTSRRTCWRGCSASRRPGRRPRAPS